MAGRVTIKTIARDLGISHMTVSRALSEHPNVQKETRELVKKRAAELGYVKSAAATAMRGDGTKIIGVLLPNIVNEFYARFANELAVLCERFDFQLIIHLTNDDYGAEQNSLQRLREVEAKAVVVVPAPQVPGTELPEPVQLEGMDVIQLIRQRPMNGQETAILVRDSNAIMAAVKTVHERGHERIAYIGADSNLSSGRNRLEAFMAGMRECGLEMRSDLVKTDAPSFSMGGQSAEHILSEGAATAIICGGFEISTGALNALLKSGRKLGEEIAFVGYGDPSFYTWIEGGVSTIGVPVLPLAQQALDVLRSQEPTEKNGKVFEFQAELTVRNS